MVECTKEEILNNIFHALADGTRRSILEKIKYEPAKVTDLAEVFPVSLNAISKHLKVLEKAGLIKRNIEGRIHFCKSNPEELAKAEIWISKYTNFWNDKLDNLETYILHNKEEK